MKACLIHFSATNVERSINLLIEYQCPQCGAPATLQETDRLFDCEYCHVKSYLVEKDFFRYILPNAAPENKNLVYVPYWRFKGMLFYCLSQGIQHRFIDVSHQAVQSRYFPFSLGFRSQTLKLQFVSQETNGRFLKPTLSFQKVMEIFDKRFTQALPKPIFHQSHIGETISLIYSPYYIDNKIYDAVSNRAVSSVLPDDFSIDLFPGGPPDWRIRFLPVLCPNCGWDLHDQPDALILHCENCNSVWQPVENSFKKLKFAHIPGEGDNLIYLPFWRIKAEISGINLISYADLVKVANLPKAIQEDWHDIKFRFWALAFKVRPRSFLRIARHMTLSQPREKMDPTLPDARIHPVTLPISEALETLKTNLADFIKPKKLVQAKLRDITIRPKSYALVYIPFDDKIHELIQPVYKVTINKNQLALAGNL